MADRLRIMVEFKKSDVEELKLYQTLLGFSSPAGIIKDILREKLPIEILHTNDNNGD